MCSLGVNCKVIKTMLLIVTQPNVGINPLVSVCCFFNCCVWRNLYIKKIHISEDEEFGWDVSTSCVGIYVLTLYINIHPSSTAHRVLHVGGGLGEEGGVRRCKSQPSYYRKTSHLFCQFRSHTETKRAITNTPVVLIMRETLELSSTSDLN